MTQKEYSRIRWLYAMDNLPVLWRIDFGLDDVYVNEYLSGKIASPLGEVKKNGIGHERGLEPLVNYTRVRKYCRSHWR